MAVRGASMRWRIEPLEPQNKNTVWRWSVDWTGGNELPSRAGHTFTLAEAVLDTTRALFGAGDAQYQTEIWDALT
jgi:hypothetical protein